MQISRHWRMNDQRYRLQGVRYENGEVSLQVRPNPPSTQSGKEEQQGSSQQVESNEEKNTMPANLEGAVSVALLTAVERMSTSEGGVPTPGKERG